jgi:hypothetical protein
MRVLHFSDNKYQVAEIFQISGSRQTSSVRVRHLQPVTFLSSAPCSLLNQKGAL